MTDTDAMKRMPSANDIKVDCDLQYQYVHVYKVRTEQEPLSSRFLYSITTIFYNIFLKFPHNHSYHSNGQPEFLPPPKISVQLAMGGYVV